MVFMLWSVEIILYPSSDLKAILWYIKLGYLNCELQSLLASNDFNNHALCLRIITLWSAKLIWISAMILKQFFEIKLANLHSKSVKYMYIHISAMI